MAHADIDSACRVLCRLVEEAACSAEPTLATCESNCRTGTSLDCSNELRLLADCGPVVMCDADGHAYYDTCLDEHDASVNCT